MAPVMGYLSSLLTGEQYIYTAYDSCSSEPSIKATPAI